VEGERKLTDGVHNLGGILFIVIKTRCNVTWVLDAS
jgi:hypothetical protein